MTSKGSNSVFITINSLAAGGAEKQAVMLAAALKDEYPTQLVVLSRKKSDPLRLEQAERLKIPLLFLPENPIRRFFYFLRLLRREKPHTLISFLPTDTVVAGICGYLAKVPLRLGGLRNSELSGGKLKMLKLTHNHLLTATLANNHTIQKRVYELGFKPPVLVIPNGIRIRKPLERVRQTGDPIHIISLGRLVSQKDYFTALEAIRILKSKYALPIKYTIAGSGPEHLTISDKIRASGLGEHVNILQNSKDIYALLEQADIYLCTSLFEGLSNALMEAMNTGLPIVATDAGDNHRLVHHEQNGYLCKPGDSRQIAHSLKELCENQELRIQMGRKGYELLKTTYSFEKFKQQYLDFLKTGRKDGHILQPQLKITRKKASK